MDRSAECSLLGPVEVWAGGEFLKLGHLRQRGVLASLLADPNRVIPVDTVIDRVWGEKSPTEARGTVYGYLSRLRRALAPVTELRLLRRAGGYVAEVPPDLVDLHRFRRLAEQARQAGDDKAAALLAEALGLWRGDALTGLTSPWALAQCAVMDNERLAAALQRFDVELRLGRHHEIVGELAEFTATRPLDEQLAGRMMLTLWRCGRQAEALNHFHHTRDELAGKLGVDPGRQLGELYERILRGEPEPAAPAADTVTVAAAPPARAPGQLPRDVPCFTGRDIELSRLHTHLGEAGGMAVIFALAGTAGVGKTALALHFAHRVAERFPDGQLYVDLRGFDPGQPPLSAAAALGCLLRALGADRERIPAGLDEQAGLYRTLLTGRRVLVVLDNAVGAEQVRPLLPGDPACLTIVTSRNRLAGLAARDGATLLDLDMLTPADAHALLARILGRRRVAAEPAATRELARLCGFLPLPLRAAAANLAGDPDRAIAVAVAELATDDRLEALAVPGDDSTAIRAAFDLSLRTLDPPARQLFRRLGLIAGPDFTVAEAAVLAEAGPVQAGRLLDRLTAAHLVERPTTGRFRLHDLLRLYARQRLDADEPAGEHSKATDRLLHRYLHLALAADQVLAPQRRRVACDSPRCEWESAPFATPAEALAWCDAEHPNLIAAIRHAARIGHHTSAWRLSTTLWGYFILRRPWGEWITVQEAVLAAVRTAGDRAGEANALNQLGVAYADLRRYDKSVRCLRHALDIWCELGDHGRRTAVLNNLGEIYYELRRFPDAIEWSQRALAIARRVEDRWGEGFALCNLGRVYRELRQFPKALRCLRQAADISHAAGDRRDEGMALHHLGETYRDLHRVDRAVDCLRTALARRREIGDRQGEARTLRELGELERDQGRLDEAEGHLCQALTVFDRLGDPRATEVVVTLRTLRSASSCFAVSAPTGPWPTSAVAKLQQSAN